MIHTKNMALMLVAIVAVASGGFFTLVEQDVQATPSGTSEQGQIIGHVTLVLTDEDGNIKAYRQTDNAVHDDGFNQIIDDAFGSAACVACQATTTNFDIIGIGTGTPGATSTNDLGIPVATATLCDRIADVTGAASTTDTFLVTISASFGGGGSTADRDDAACQVAVTEAGLFNSATDATGEMFAAQGFAAINIATATDVLTVTWELTFS